MEHQQQQEREHDPQQMMRQRHQMTLWVHFAAITLGVFLATSPFTFGYDDRLMIWNDVICGLLIVVIGALSISPERSMIRWANCAVGIWLLFAPLVFWSADPTAYLVDTTVGPLVIAFAILVPGMPGMRMLAGPTMPPGWSYNPSSWLQRAPVIALGLISFFIARYMAAFQLGYIDHVWDPIFGGGTVEILDSDVSHAWPVSDAGFGATAYMLEALSGFMGGRNRWRTMPWMVLMFGFLVIPLGITSIVLVILQPVMVGTWCMLCLLTALFMLLMIPLAVDEVVAMGQFMARIRREGKPFWVNFWQGGTLDTDEPDEEEITTWQSPRPAIGSAMVRGVNLPWNLLVSAALGLWLMGAPAIFDTSGWAANSNYLFGPLIVVVAVSAMAEVVRPFRFLNIGFGVWIALAPLILTGASMTATISNIVIGLALIALSLPRGPISQQYAGWRRHVV